MVMKKRVNIYPRGPITTLDPPIRTVVKNVTKDISDIRKCIIAGATVEEVLNATTVVPLNLNNYDKDNGGILDAAPNNVRFDKAAPPVEDEPPEPEQKEIVTMNVPEPMNIPAPEDIKPPEKPKHDPTENMVEENDDKEVEISVEDIEDPYKNMTRKQRRRAKAAAERKAQEEAEKAVEESNTEEETLNVIDPETL